MKRGLLKGSNINITPQFHPDTQAKCQMLKKQMSNDGLEDKKKTLHIDKLYVDGMQLIPPELDKEQVPQNYDMGAVDWDNEMPEVRHTACHMEKGNKFMAYTAKVDSVEGVKLALDAIVAIQASDLALHLAHAYRVEKAVGRLDRPPG